MMVVIGIDVGNDSCVVSIYRNGQVETVKNDSNVCNTPSMISFSKRKRDIGVAATKQWYFNINSTVFDIKNTLGSVINKKWKFNILRCTENTKDAVLCFDISILNRKLKLSSCQVLAMLLTKIKSDAQALLQSNAGITGCVLAVPSYFNVTERKNILIAAGIARLDCHFLIKETTAVAINYSAYRKFSTPINVIFIDFGQNSIQIFACKFSERQLEVIEEVSELIGGRDIDEMLADYIIENFKIPGADKKSKIFCIQLLSAVEELKKKMTTKDESLMLNYNQLLKIDNIFIKRADMENICEPLFKKIQVLMQLLLERSKLNIEDIHSIEMVGGSSRIHVIEKLVEKVFGQTPISSMHREESIARGCLFKSIMSVKRRGFKIKEKPFADTKQPSSTELRDNVRLFQIHKTLKDDAVDPLNVTEDQFMEYVEIESQLAQYDIDEAERSNARNKFYAFLSEHMRLPSGSLQNLDAKRAKELSDLRMWNDGTKEEYDNLLGYWTKEVDKIKNRNLIQMEQEQDQYKHDFGFTINQQLDHYDVNNRSVKKPRIQDDIKAIPSSQAIRNGLNSRHSKRRDDKFAHSPQKSYSEGDRHNKRNENQNLIIKENRSRNKRKINWCCFL